MGKKMDARQYIKLRGANENNLKNIDVDIPRRGDIWSLCLLMQDSS